MNYKTIGKGIFRLLGNNKLYNNNIKAVILDWSGTTIDSHVIAPAIAFQKVFKKHQVPITLEEARYPMGLRKDIHIQKILEIPNVRQKWFYAKKKLPTTEDVQQLFKDFIPIQIECLHDYTSLIPGTVDVIKKLREEYNIKIGSTTGYNRDILNILLKDAEKQGYIPESNIASDDVENNMGFRPTPFMLYKNLIQLGVYPISSVIKVDDTIEGVNEGLNAGCWSVGVYGNSNYTNIESIKQWDNMTKNQKEEKIDKSIYQLMNSKAHYVIKSIKHLPDIIEDINKRLKMGDKP